MKLSISNSAAYGVRKNGKVEFLPELAIRQCAQAGFDRMEYNFQTGPAAAKPLAGSNWKETVTRLGQVLEENRITVPYTHDFWYIIANAKGPEDIDMKDEMVRRSVEATHMLGAPMMVAHAQSLYDENGYNADKTREYNRNFFHELGDLAAKHSISIVVENVFPIAGCLEFTSYAEDMAELMQDLNDPMFGICWDFGHANMAKVDHEKSLEIIAPWLRHIHVDDNKATSDDHTVPGYGTVPWDRIMPKLKQVGYTGDLNLNIRTFAQTSLPNQRVEALRLLHKVGSDLIQMYNEA